MSTRPAPAAQLVPLTLAVLLAHAVALQWQPPAPDSLSPATSSFLTRQVAAAVGPEPAPSPPAATSQPPRRPVPKPATRADGAPSPPTASAPAAPSPASHDTGPPAAAPASEPAPAGPPARAFAFPEPGRMHYEVSIEARGVHLRGHAQLDWRHDGSQYAARLELSAPFLPSRIQSSTGRITAEGLAPSRFSDQGRRGEEATHFAREQGRLVFSNNRPEQPLADGMQDRLSVMVQLAALVGGNPAAYPPGSSINVPTAGLRDAENWVFTVEAEEDLSLPGGPLRGLKLQRVPRKEFDQKIELWLAPTKDYAPVRLRLTNPNGDSVDQRWSSTDKG